jgi:hypothetical protein
MKNLSICSLALLSVSILLQAQMTVPQLGVAHYADGSVHLVRGISANMIIEPQQWATADAASFSDSIGVVSASGSIRLLQTDGTLLGAYQTSETSPLLHVDSTAASTAVWLPSKHALLGWNGTRFTETAIDDSSFGGTVTFVYLPSSTSAQFFVTHANQSIARVSVALPSGQVTSSDIEPLARGWIVVQQGWSLSQTEMGLVAENATGTQQTIPLSQKAIPAGDLRVEQMSSHWLHVFSQSTATNWAIYLDQNKVNSFLLPPPARPRLVAPHPPAHEVFR